MTQDQKRYLNFLESEMAETLAESEHDEEANMRDVIALDEDIIERQKIGLMQQARRIDALERERRALWIIMGVASVAFGIAFGVALR